jgi:dTDP-4-dehydrorhamnose 3,5-epimerase-like enzyme
VSGHFIQENRDHRGVLQVLELRDFLNFEVKRIFSISDVPADEVRGNHAHRQSHQLLWLISGVVKLEVWNSHGSEALELSATNRSHHLPPLHWGKLSQFSENAVLIVLASDNYDPADYIIDFPIFKSLVGLK